MKRILIILILIFSAKLLFGQEREALVPDFAVLQYAGSIGYGSIGAGYDIFKNRGRLSAHFGTVPRSEGGPLNIVSAKLFVEPWTLAVSERATINPADIGIMASYHTGEGFKENIPDYFASRNYYWFHTNLRMHLAVETSLTVKMDEKRFFRKLTGYTEINTNDLYLVSYFANASTLELHELIKLGAGLRLCF